MKLRKFESYARYRDAQVAANRLKFGNVFADERELRRIAEYVRAAQPAARTGLCHGVRNGYEVDVLRRLLPGVDIRGTDISETAARLPHCMVWDMHEVKPEWVGAIDLIYSNSWDHSYDPAAMFARWSTCLTPTGRLFLAYTELHSGGAESATSVSDVFGCSLDELIGLVRTAFLVEDVLEIEPHLTRRMVRQKLSYLRMGRYAKLFGTGLRSRRVVVLVLGRRPDARG